VQVQVLAERLEELLDEVRRRGTDVPVVVPSELEDVRPLDQPIMEEFRVGTMALAWDTDDSVVVVEAHAATDDDQPDDDPTRTPTTDRTCCGCGSPQRTAARSSSGRCASSPPADRRARCAASRWTRRATSARARTATTTDNVPMTPDAAPEPAAVDADRVLELLRAGEIDIEGRLVDASNATLYCAISDPAMTAACVYKPIRGERPLWDFPDGTLAYREVAAYRVSEATGWSIVPPTVLRDGPVGPGMVQLWIDVDESVDLAALVRARQPALRRMALFDAVVNNADRKGGHLLPLPDGHVYGVDHGVCFSVEPKLRTVLWGWRGERLDDDELFVLSDLRASSPDRCAPTCRRCSHPTRSRRRPLASTRCSPLGASRSRAPTGPAIPWPPF
jgi:uncharacterized repeat protein (TIGR03843 family)